MIKKLLVLAKFQLKNQMRLKLYKKRNNNYQMKFKNLKMN